MSTVRREPGPAVRSRVNALLIDDGETYEAALRDHLPELTLVGPRQPDGLAALAFLSQNDHADRTDLVLLDVHFDVPESRLLPLGEGATLRQTRRAQGVAILRELRARWPHLPVVLLTSADELPFDALRAELAAAPSTFMLGGDDLDALRIRVHEALAARRLAREEDGVFWGRDAGMVAARRRLAVLARGRMPVILEGETGTGKSYIAERWIHAQSGRPGPFIAADLSTLPPDLVPAYLFGAQRGAYTGAVADRKGVFELAGGGTLFLDEVQNLSAETQRQLLLVLQDRRVRPLGASRDVPVDVKVIAASNQSLAGAVAAGRFRADLYMRLGPATRVVLPPLTSPAVGVSRRLVRTFVEGSTDDPGRRRPAGSGRGRPGAAPGGRRAPRREPGPARTGGERARGGAAAAGLAGAAGPSLARQRPGAGHGPAQRRRLHPGRRRRCTGRGRQPARPAAAGRSAPRRRVAARQPAPRCRPLHRRLIRRTARAPSRSSTPPPPADGPDRSARERAPGEPAAAGRSRSSTRPGGYPERRGAGRRATVLHPSLPRDGRRLRTHGGAAPG
jgi:CheY-like chemotaxis protein